MVQIQKLRQLFRFDLENMIQRTRQSVGSHTPDASMTNATAEYDSMAEINRVCSQSVNVVRS